MDEILGNWRYSFLFIGAGVLLLFLEVFVPSGGILGFLSLGCSAFGIYGLFSAGHPWLGLGAIVGTTAVTIIGLRYGLRRLAFTGTLAVDTGPSSGYESQMLLGREGITHTPLRPAGIATFDGKKVDVLTQGSFIEARVRVKVVDSSGGRIVVKEIE